MKVLVAIKRVIHSDVKIHFSKGGVQTQNVKMGMNPFDEIALEEAVRWKAQNLIAEIIVVSIGPEATCETLRMGFALGADRGILWSTDLSLEPLNVAKLLCLTIQEEAPDIVIMGKQAIDDDSSQTAQMVAAMLNWPQATHASKIVWSEHPDMVTVMCETDEGVQTLQLMLPCVITAAYSLNTPRSLSLPNIMKAKSKPLQIRSLPQDLNLRPRTRVIQVAAPEPRKQGIKVKTVTELIHYLRNIEKLI